MADYAGAQTLMQDGLWRHRVRCAILDEAKLVQAEAPETEGHAARSVLAYRLAHELAKMDNMSLSVAIQAGIAATSTDSELKEAAAIIWNMYAFTGT